MQRILAAFLAAGVCCCGATAASYDDFTAAMTAALRKDYEAAIKGFSAAIAAPDLVAAYRPAAYRGRASALLQLDRCDAAMADLDAYRALKPQDEDIFRLHMWISLCRKDVVAARQDFETLTKFEPPPQDDKEKGSEALRKASRLFSFARLEWRYGLYSEAAATARDAYYGVDKKSAMAPYILLWQAVSEVRAGHLDEAALNTSLNLWARDDWPRPIFEFYLGKTAWKDLERDAASWQEYKDAARRCQANFYGAEWHLGHNDTATATRLLLAVVDKCPLDFLENGAARSELKRLGVAVPEEQ